MRLCKDSTNPPSHGWPGGMNAWSVSRSLAQRPKAPAMNSGPLSARSTWWSGLVLWTGCFEGCWLLLVVLRPLARVLVG